jgi:hypothetical protein
MTIRHECRSCEQFFAEKDFMTTIGVCMKCFKTQYNPDAETFAPLEKGGRNNAGKPQLSYNLLGAAVQVGEAAVWQFGAEKYARGNWLKGREYTDCANSLLRHLTDFLSGVDNDIETGLPHVDHIVCCAKILSNAFHTRKDLDDRK